MHTVPGEHDVTDGPGAEYLHPLRQGLGQQAAITASTTTGVHFMALVNVHELQGRAASARWATISSRGSKDDLAGALGQPADRGLRAHAAVDHLRALGLGHGAMREQMCRYARRFGSVTVLNGHIHQIVQKVEGNITFHTARSTAYPQPTAGNGPGPGAAEGRRRPAAEDAGRDAVCGSCAARDRLRISDSTLA